MYFAFVDLTKAFGNVSREALWEVLGKIGCSPRYSVVLRSLHEASHAHVVHWSGLSESFPVEAGVRQGCVVAQSIFNLFVAAVTSVCMRDTRVEGSINISYRLDGSLFNLNLLKTKTYTRETSIIYLQYADDSALVGAPGEGLQRTLNCVARIYERSGLKTNTKTQVFSQLQHLRIISKIKVSERKLEDVQQCRYLWSILADLCDLTEERGGWDLLQRHMVGWRLALFQKHNWSLHT